MLLVCYLKLNVFKCKKASAEAAVNIIQKERKSAFLFSAECKVDKSTQTFMSGRDAEEVDGVDRGPKDVDCSSELQEEMPHLFHDLKESEVGLAAAFVHEGLRVTVLRDSISLRLVQDGNFLGTEKLFSVIASLVMIGPSYHHVADV